MIENITNKISKITQKYHKLTFPKTLMNKAIMKALIKNFTKTFISTKKFRKLKALKIRVMKVLNTKFLMMK